MTFKALELHATPVPYYIIKTDMAGTQTSKVTDIPEHFKWASEVILFEKYIEVFLVL
jgi:hypothetical protein